MHPARARRPLAALSPLALVCAVACKPAAEGKPTPDAQDDTAAPPVDAAPSAPTVALTPDAPRTADDLAVRIVADAVDPEGAAVTYRAVWSQGGMARPDLTGLTVPAAETSRGEEWAVEVFASDGTTEGPPGVARVTIGNTAPTAPSVEISPAEPAPGEALRCGVAGESADEDGDALAYQVRWEVDGVAFPGAEDGAWPGDTVPAGRTQDGEVWACAVAAGDGADLSPEGAASVTVVAVCADGAVEQCGDGLAGLDWELAAYPSAACDGARSAVTLGAVPGTSPDTACGQALDLSAAGHQAQAVLAPTYAECPGDGMLHFEMVGRLPENYQRGLNFTLDFPSGGRIVFDRWVWNWHQESSANVNVYTAAGDLQTYLSSNADTGGARNDRPWGWYIGNDGGWFTLALSVDTAADRVVATVSQPTLTATVYTAEYALDVVEGELPTVTFGSWGNCDSNNRVAIDAELLSFTASPGTWL